MNDAERGAYLRALGIESWRPRAQPAPDEPVAAPRAEPVGEAANRLAARPPVATVSPSAAAPAATPVTAAAPVTAAEPAPQKAPGTAPEVASGHRPPPTPEQPVATPAAPAAEPPPPAAPAPARDQLQDNHAHECLARSALRWQRAPAPGCRLAVIALDASGPQLRPGELDQHLPVLQKMLAAIGESLDAAALGVLSWEAGDATGDIASPYALLLVDSGPDAGALIAYWRDKLLSLHGARAVIAPHPRMFEQGVALKRQAWESLQMLQQQWAD